MSIVDTINSLMRGARVTPRADGARIVTAIDAGRQELPYYILVSADEDVVSVSNGTDVVCEFGSEAEARASHFFRGATRFDEWRQGADGFYTL